MHQSVSFLSLSPLSLPLCFFDTHIDNNIFKNYILSIRGFLKKKRRTNSLRNAVCLLEAPIVIKCDKHTLFYDYTHFIDKDFTKSFSCQVCNQFHAQAAHIFGKRADPVELSLDGDCCSGDLCNHHVLVHASTTTTSSPTDSKVIHCYDNHYLINQKNINKQHYHTDALNLRST